MVMQETPLPTDGIQFSQLLNDHYSQLARLTPLQCTFIYARERMKRNNQIRQHVHNGDYASLSLDEVFHTMHKTHMGDYEPIKYLIANYDPDPDFAINLSSESSDNTFAKLADHLDTQPFTAQKLAYGSLRTDELPTMVKIDRDRVMLFGVPAAIVQPVFNRFFSIAEKVVEQRGRFTDEEKIAFTAAAGTFLAYFHFKTEGNGRTALDWIVELQRRLFDEDLSKARAYTTNSLRVQGVNALLKPEHRLLYRERDTSMWERGKAAMYFSQTLRQRFLEKFAQIRPKAFGVYEEAFARAGVDEERARVLQITLISHADVLYTILDECMEGLTDREVQKKFGLRRETVEERGMVEVLMDTAPYSYQGLSFMEVVDIGTLSRQMVREGLFIEQLLNIRL